MIKQPDNQVDKNGETQRVTRSLDLTLGKFSGLRSSHKKHPGVYRFPARHGGPSARSHSAHTARPLCIGIGGVDVSMKSRSYRWSGDGGLPRAWYVDVEQPNLDSQPAYLRQYIFHGKDVDIPFQPDHRLRSLLDEVLMLHTQLAPAVFEQQRCVRMSRPSRKRGA